MKVKVTLTDIETGTRGDIHRCPVTLALRRASGDPKAWVGRTVLSVGGKSIKSPKTVQKFTENFDLRNPVQPFEFSIPERKKQ